MIGDIELERAVGALETLDLEGLRKEWQRRWEAPPRLRSVQLLRYLTVWRIQAEARGGLDIETRRLLRQTSVATQGPVFRPGQRLAREWRGVLYDVEIVAGGFVHAGKTYKSLSQIARAITGTQWNGPRFFGLREGAVSLTLTCLCFPRLSGAGEFSFGGNIV